MPWRIIFQKNLFDTRAKGICKKSKKPLTNRDISARTLGMKQGFTSRVFAYHSFDFFSDVQDEDVNVCAEFMQHCGFSKDDKVKLVATIKNPKKKGWLKVSWQDATHARINNKKRFYFALSQREQLRDMGFLNVDFWVRLEKIN